MTEIRFIKRLEKVPRTKGQILNLAPPKANATVLRNFVSLFGVDAKAGRLAQDRATFTYTAGTNVFVLFKASGAFHFHDSHRWEVDDGTSKVAFSDEQVVELGKRMVTKLKLAKPREFEVLKVARLHVGEMPTSNGRRAADRAIDAAVCFRRVVNGIPVDGPGGKITLYFDAAGKLSGLDQTWRQIAAVRAPVAKLRPPEEAEEDIKRYWASHSMGRIDVHDMRFGYFEFGPAETQRVLQPAYILPLSLVSTDDNVLMRSVHVMPAATNAVGTIMPPPPRTVRQPARVG